MTTSPTGRPRFEETPFGDAIPRLIHQTFGNGPLPDAFGRNIAAIKAMNPGWQHCFYDDDDILAFIRAEYDTAMLDTYLSINPCYGAARADLFRYLLLYRRGGVYLDIKSSATRPLDDILRPDDRFVLAQWQNDAGGERAGWGIDAALADVPGGEFQQWHIIAAPGHPFLRAVILSVLDGIDDYRPWRHGVGRAAVLATTGPIAYTRAIVPLRPVSPYREVRCEADLGLRYSFISDFGHQRLFSGHYTRAVVPLIDRPGLAGATDRGYARLLRWRNALAVATYPLRRDMRRRLAGVPREEAPDT